MQNLHYSNKVAIFVSSIKNIKMAAPKNNTNAKKWTANKVWYQVSKVYKATKNPKELFLGQVLERLGLYKDIWAYWKRKYAANERIMYQMELIEQGFEVNVFKAGMEGRLPEKLAILILKNVYGWRDNPKEEEIAHEENTVIRMAHRDMGAYSGPLAKAA
jgi:hypothetical protein